MVIWDEFSFSKSSHLLLKYLFKFPISNSNNEQTGFKYSFEVVGHSGFWVQTHVTFLWKQVNKDLFPG
jgi:hypothetical protein